MLRAVVAVVLATTLLATSLPALDAGARDHSNTMVAAEADRIVDAMRDLDRRETAARAGTPGARRVVTVRLPERGWITAGVDYVAVGGRPDRGADASHATAVAWKVDAGTVRTRRVVGIRVEHARNGRVVDAPLVLRAGGTHRLSLTLVEREGERTVVVRRLPEV